MDKLNRFHSQATYKLLRFDYFALAAACSLVVLVNYREVNWGRFALAFSWIDLVGTLPAYYVYYRLRRGAHRSIHPLFYGLYNFAHSYAVNLAVVAIWALARGHFELAMLAPAIHICGDRSLFGNVYKSTRTSFEPVKLRAFEQFEAELRSASPW
jgi:hypothetical protein